MTIEEKQQITALCLTDKWRMDKNILAYLDEIQVVDAVKEQRTPQQNAALHLFCTQLADGLNEGGYTVQVVVKEKMDIDWTPRLVKELLWRNSQRAILGKESTTELSKLSDIDKVYDHHEDVEVRGLD